MTLLAGELSVPTWSFALPTRLRLVRLFALTISAALVLSAGAAAQDLPSPEQAERLLNQARLQPALAAQIRQRISQSGLTPDQIRARLRASGYPEALLDAYLGPASGETPAGALELAAVDALGVPPLPSPGLPVDTGAIRSRATREPSTVFGVDVFQRSTTQFLPLLTGPVPSTYRLGPGDGLVLILTGGVEQAHTLPVTREGFIVVPDAGQIYVANLTLTELREVLYDRLRRVYSSIGRSPNAKTQFHISVAQVRAVQVYVVGEVPQPGAYQISAMGTLLSALYAAGGVTERANMRQIELRRDNEIVASLDLYDYLLHGNTRNDVRVETGDVIFVPVHGTRVHVTGAVVRPSIYEIAPGETLAEVLEAAGGFRPEAELRRIAVHRIVPPTERGPGPFPRVALDVPLEAPAAVGSTRPANPFPVPVPRLPLEAGDSIVVDEIPALWASYYVYITGMVRKPGAYPWHPGMTLRDLVLLARGPRVGAYLKEAEVARLPKDREDGQLAVTLRVPLDSSYLFERDALGTYIGPPGIAVPASGAPELPLAPYDNVLILQQPEFDFQRGVVLTGQFRFPGRYTLRSKDERLVDIIERAGGLTSRAYAEGIRFHRRESGAGRINIDLPRAQRDAGARDNVLLQPGDSIDIPEYIPSVRVLGAVNAPGSVLWRESASLEYYIEGAGGYAAHAEKKRVAVRYANGDTRTRHRSLLFSSDPKPGPGSEVVVPARDPGARRTDPVALAGALAQILSSTVAILVVLRQ